MKSSASQKELAVKVHSTQAAEFETSYSTLGQAPYASCFAYSRTRLGEWLQHLLPPRGDGLRALDVGCGTGHHLEWLRERGFEGAGIDASGEMLALARQRNPEADLRLADVESLPFPNASFDVVLCIEVLRYLPEMSRCLSEIGRVLVPGGVCVATATPLLNLNGYYLVNRLAPVLPVKDLVGLRQYFTTSWNLGRTLAEAGLSPFEIHGVYFGPINWVERLAPRQLPRVLSAWRPIDRALCDRLPWRELSNMFVVRASRGAG
ncbi:MAG: class I SAM-dependent methyltransferase [Candidatus Binatia bacterium]